MVVKKHLQSGICKGKAGEVGVMSVGMGGWGGLPSRLG